MRSPETVTIASRTSLIASDVLLLGVTWFSTLKWRHLTRAAGRTTESLSGILFRDGKWFLVSVAREELTAIWGPLGTIYCA